MLGLARSTWYYRPLGETAKNLRLMRAIDELYLQAPFYGSRKMAVELRVNRNTVAKAYAELEAQGVVETHPGKGCFLRVPHSPLRKDARLKALAESIDESVIQAHHLQLSRTDFLRLAEERYDTLATRRERAATGDRP